MKRFLSAIFISIFLLVGGIEVGAQPGSPIGRAASTSVVYTAASEAIMLALTAKVGDFCVRSDNATTYILQTLPASFLANWASIVGGPAGGTAYQVRRINRAGTAEEYFDIRTDFNVVDYAPGTQTSTTISAAMVAVGGGELVVKKGTWTIDSDIVVPAGTTLRFSRGAILNIDPGKYITFVAGSSLKAGIQQIFSGTGGVIIGAGVVSEVYAEWWGDNTVPGTTDMITPIQSAVNSISNIGGTVKLLANTYLVSSQINIYGNNITIAGQGPALTTIKISGDTATGIAVPGSAGTWYSYVTIKDLMITRSITNPTAGYGIYLGYTQYVKIENVDIFHCNTGVWATRSSYLICDRVQVQRTAGTDVAYGFFLDCTTGYSSSTKFISCLAIFNGHTGTTVGFMVTGDYTQDKLFMYCGVEVATIGYYVNRDTYGTYGAFNIFFEGCYADSIAQYGFYLNNLGASSISGGYTLVAGTGIANFGTYLVGCKNMTLNGNVHWGIGNPGFHYGVSLTNSNNITVADSTFYGVEYGIYLDRSRRITMTGNTFYQSSTNPATAFIEFTGSPMSSNTTIVGNTFDGYADAGIIFQAGADNNIVMGNVFDSASIGTKVYNVGSGNIVKSNSGYMTENFGYTTVPIASGTTIAHGLASSPAYISVTPADTGVSDVYVTSDATNITIHFYGAGSHYFFWKVALYP